MVAVVGSGYHSKTTNNAELTSMIIVLSDLHLTDDIRDSELRSAAFTGLLDAVFDHFSAISATDNELVLLGDIFDLTRSARWISEGARPWKAREAIDFQIVLDIVTEIGSKNIKFFSRLQSLQQCYGVNLTLCLGNHDALLGVPGCEPALKEVLRLLGPRAVYHGEPSLRRQSYKLVATHGHLLSEREESNTIGTATAEILALEVLAEMERRLSLITASRQSDNEMRLLYFAPHITFASGWISTIRGLSQSQRSDLLSSFRQVLASVYFQRDKARRLPHSVMINLFILSVALKLNLSTNLQRKLVSAMFKSPRMSILHASESIIGDGSPQSERLLVVGHFDEDDMPHQIRSKAVYASAAAIALVGTWIHTSSGNPSASFTATYLVMNASTDTRSRWFLDHYRTSLNV